MILLIHFQVVPNIQKGNEGIVHHFVVYECNGSFNESDFDQGADCSDDNTDVPYFKCRFSTIVTTWAKGRDVSNFTFAFACMH